MICSAFQLLSKIIQGTLEELSTLILYLQVPTHPSMQFSRSARELRQHFILPHHEMNYNLVRPGMISFFVKL